MRPEHEQRFHQGIELRASGEANPGPGTLTAYVSVFDSPSELLSTRDGKRKFVERVRPGAFTRTLAGADIRALADHDTGKVIGRNTAGTLRLVQDERGLKAEIDLPDTAVGRDTAVSVARRDVSGMSFGFFIPPGGDKWDFSVEPAVRSLLDVDLDEVSVVAFPAYPDTSVAVRSLEKALSEVENPGEPVEAPGPDVPAPDSTRSVPLSVFRDRLRTLGNS